MSVELMNLDEPKSVSDATNDKDTDQDVYTLTADKVSESLKVFSLAYFDSINKEFDSSKKYGIVNVKPFPLEKTQGEFTLPVYCFSESTMKDLKKNDFVGVVFADLDFRNNLSAIDNKPKELYSEEINRHKQSFAVLINLK